MTPIGLLFGKPPPGNIPKLKEIMVNIFREILKELPDPKIEIIADDPKDQKIADQMSKLINWKLKEERNVSVKK